LRSLADRLGRKKAIVVDNMILIIGIVIQVASVSAWVRLASLPALLLQTQR